MEREKQEHLEKLKHDLGEGEAVAMTIPKPSAQASRPPGISIGLTLDSDDDSDATDEEGEEEINEQESFKRFIEREMQKKGQDEGQEKSGSLFTEGERKKQE